MTSYSKGIDAESKALKAYQNQGFVPFNKRYKTKVGEIDLIVGDDDIVIFVEVKMRKTVETAAFSLNAVQQKRIAATAEIWLAENPDHAHKDCRFDVALLTANAIELIENVILGE